MRRNRVSAADVAREANVSRTTVSFVLNNTIGKNIREETRQRVMDAAARLGYVPNEHARKLASMRNRNLGLFISHSQFVYSDAFITRALEGMSQAVNRARARLIVQPVAFRETSYVELARANDVQGIILINTHDEDPALRELEESRFPAVSMDYIGDSSIDQVYVDNAAAALEVVRYLIGLGHRRIAMITHASPTYYASRRRMDGYRQALEEAGMEFDQSLVRHGNFSEQSGYEQMKNLLGSEEEFTAVFAGNDVVAYGAMQAIFHSGRKIPEDVSLVGFDDDYMSRFLNPGLTTMVLPASGHGSVAVTTLMERIDGEAPAGPVYRVLNAYIALRESAGPPRGR